MLFEAFDVPKAMAGWDRFAQDTPARVGTAVVGGHVYRGEALTGLRGRYVFGDWSRESRRPRARFSWRASPPNGANFGSCRKVLDVPGRVLSLGRDKDGELYVLTNDEAGPFGQTGKVYKLVRRSE